MTTTPEPEAIATARAQGARDMRDAILRWHGERLIYYRNLSGTNAFAGAVMFAHERSIAAISALNVDPTAGAP